ncbi:hypothetical protein TNCV_3365191 [Trichonephila clavipes]|nr:hypothetical protein TNCV_3365191 [Trichonephila clavipes]
MELKLFRINLGLGQKVTKRSRDPSTLRALALEVLNILYTKPEWLRIFTDGTILCGSPNAGMLEFSPIFFSFYDPMRRGTVLYGKIAVIHTAVSQQQCLLEKIKRAVFLSDSRAALLVIVSDNNPITQDVLNFRHDLTNLASFGKSIVLQWVPAHRGVPCGERNFTS